MRQVFEAFIAVFGLAVAGGFLAGLFAGTLAYFFRLGWQIGYW